VTVGIWVDRRRLPPRSDLRYRWIIRRRLLGCVIFPENDHFAHVPGSMFRVTLASVIARFCRATMLFAVSGLITACGVTPPLGRGLPSAVDDADHTFNARVNSRFPVGSASTPLLEELQRERFKIDPHSEPGQQIARYFKDGLPCRQDWIVSWSTDNSMITAITGRYAVACL